MAYKQFSNLPVKEFEANLAKKWEETDLLNKSIQLRKDKEGFVFYDGPPTANGIPGIHHVIARALKDSVCRYKSMKGYEVKRKAGWDTHGLPVEIEVEKRLNLSSKQDIEKYGIAEFNEKCRGSVFEYESYWREQTKRMAYLIDLDNPYITLDNDYIESEWYILDRFFKEDMIYEGHKILPYCARCGTGLASHEVALGYQEVKTDTVFVKFKLKDKDEYFLVWTTTPWTLASNVALTVNKDETYLKVDNEGVILYVEKNLSKTVLKGEYEVLEEFKGSDLEYTEYEQLMPFVKTDKKAFFVTCADYVTVDDGTGIVHTAPAFGEDDYNTGLRYGLPVLQPVDEEGKYVETPWKGMFVMDADRHIIDRLKAEGKLYRKEKTEHNYPHCWRCSTPLLYYAKPSWYIKMTALKDSLVKNNGEVNWFPPYVGEKRFGNWLENVNDWAISRSRYWGTPLNIWRCENEECSNLTSIGSRSELSERAVENTGIDIELHRPYVDDIHIKCEKCSSLMSRVPDVIDCWFDSGAMPFAQHHYPFENKDNFDELFPADFICEGIDQTRGWFYSLLAISTFIMGKAPYKNVLVNDLILDKEGKKMSKSRGNGVDSFELFDKYGADAVRWYLYYVSPAWVPTRFDEDGIKEVAGKFFNTLKNVYNFFTLYANTDGIDASTFNVAPCDRPELDRWLLSRMNNLIKDVEASMDVFDTTKAVRAIQDFVNEDMSNWYIRRSRRRFWEIELTEDKKSVYQTTLEALICVAKLSAPFAPYTAEEVYTKLTGMESVHLSDFPICDETVTDDAVEEKMNLVRTLMTLGRGARESVRIKVRQPIAKVLVDGKHKDILVDSVDLMKEELNVKEVVFAENLQDYMNFELKPNFKVLGPILGKNMKLFAEQLGKLKAEDAAPHIDAGGSAEIDVDGTPFTVTSEHVLINISAKEGFTVAMENNVFVILDTTLTQELVDEGYARELISKVQQMRKAKDFDMLDNINIGYVCDDEFERGISVFRDHIMGETLAKSMVRCDGSGASAGMEKYDLNGHSVDMAIEKI